VIDTGLREDFGFQHILWVYSGRRGIHCWVCDEAARTLTDEQRGAVANFFAIYKGQEKNVPKVALSAPSRNHLCVGSGVRFRIWWEKYLEVTERSWVFPHK
jgi:DNA primase small subunit